jgi:peptidoglycan/xylan/chitin deacetylase (PgdA/CDA1 family)
MCRTVGGLALAALLAGCVSASSPPPSAPTVPPPSPTVSPSAQATPSAAASAVTPPPATPPQTPHPATGPPTSASPAPTHAPTPQPTASPTPSVVPSAIVSHGTRGSGLVALTFDMGGIAEPVVPIMSWLRDHEIPATIFVAGWMIDSRYTDVGRQTLAIMATRPDLFELASHGYNHPDMRTLSEAEIERELRLLEESLARLGAGDPRPLFRPPSGYQNATVLAVAGRLGYAYTVLWDVDPLDWKKVENGGPTAPQIVDKVAGSAEGGSIVLLHLSGTQTLEALPGIIEGLAARGLRPVTVGEMRGIRD